MTTQVRRAPGTLTILSASLDDLLQLADPEAAESLNQWMGALKRVEEVYEVSYGQRLVIIRHFEERSLWRHLIDPDTDLAFPNLTAWLSSGFVGCRRVNMEAHRDAQALSDLPSGKLIYVPKGSVKVLKLLSTSVRNDPEVLEAARTMKPEEFEAKVERDHPMQHIESRRAVRFSLGRSQAKTVEKWIAYALEHDVAGSREEAIERACEVAMHDAELNEELRSMPEGETAVQ